MSSLSDRLQDIFTKLKGKGKLSEADVNTAMREVRVALLEADVNYKIAKDFCATVKERAIGEEVMKSLTPGQQVVKIVNEELTTLMGGDSTKSNANKLITSSKPPTVILMAGLQGSGKTTSAGKIALHLKNPGQTPSAGSRRRLPPSCHPAAGGTRAENRRTGIFARRPGPAR